MRRRKAQLVLVTLISSSVRNEPAAKHSYCQCSKSNLPVTAKLFSFIVEVTVTAPDDEDLYIIGASCPGPGGCYITTNNHGNRHKLFKGQEKSFWLLNDEHQVYDSRNSGGALYLMKRTGDYYYIGWNQQQFVGLHEDDLETREFLDDGDETKTDCLMVGVFDYFSSSDGPRSKSGKAEGYRVLQPKSQKSDK